MDIYIDGAIVSSANSVGHAITVKHANGKTLCDIHISANTISVMDADGHVVTLANVAAKTGLNTHDFWAGKPITDLVAPNVSAGSYFDGKPITAELDAIACGNNACAHGGDCDCNHDQPGALTDADAYTRW